MSEETHRWHHRPAHLFQPNTMYFVTAGTLHKQHFFRSNERLQMLQDTLFRVAGDYRWLLQAWAVFSNHYHFIAQSPEDPKTLKGMLQRLHSQTARTVNKLDDLRGRQVWIQYRDTCLTYEKSFYARLNYVNNNPVKHGLAVVAGQYPFCSAKWFKEKADAAFRKKVESFRYDRIRIEDDF